MHVSSRCSPTLLALACSSPRATLTANFFSSFFEPPANPADDYDPDLSLKPPALPRSYDEMHELAVDGVLSAVSSSNARVEVEFPPIASVNARGDGSAKSDAVIAAANAEFVEKLTARLAADGRSTTVIGCGASTRRALSGAVSLRDAPRVVGADDVAVVVAPADIEQWEAAAALDCACVVVVNGLINNGLHPHAFYYKALTAFSSQTGACVRCFPGAYAIYDVGGEHISQLAVPLARQGRRALPDTKEAQMWLQSQFGARQSS